MKKREFDIIGKAPKHVEKEDILSYFLYVFEFTWGNSTFKDVVSRLETYFSEQAESLKPNYSSLSAEKEWWLYILIALKKTVEEEMKYAHATIENIIKRIDIISEDLLERQVNELQNIFYSEASNILIMRPLEMEKLSCSLAKSDHFLPFFLENKERFLHVLEKNLRQKDVDKSYCEAFMPNDKKIYRKYSSFWNGYYEIFMQYFISLYDFWIPFKMESFEEEVAIVEKMTTVFFSQSILTKERVEDATDGFMEIIEELVEKDGNWDS